ncbi:MAG: hypothetical protein LBR88_04715 [Zoogloeaceae bacterium]|jgi:hypothetical protein|nr:hypothetical protein [Zoogloeaceae bacterium]
MSKIQRLVVLVLLFWGGVILAAWWRLSPPQPLVGGKTPLPALEENIGYLLERPDLSGALLALERVPLWGVGRDGSSLPKPKSEVELAEETRPVVWRFVAAIARANERYVLIVEEGKPAPQAVKEGEALPNEGKLLHVDAKTVVYLDRDKKRHAEHLSF